MKKERKRNLIFILTILTSSVYLIWRIFFTLPFGTGFFQVFCGILLAGAETMTTLGMFELMISRMKCRESMIRFPETADMEFPHVDVFIATHNETAGLLYKTVNACTFMEYPDKDKVHIYICDDGDREEIRKLAEQFHVGYLGLSGNKHAKSGNYNHALEQTKSPLIATFDADMIPRRQFLMRTVPYFMIPEIPMGLVQTPQSFYNQDLFQFNLYSEKNIPNEQDFFSREINVMRNSSNSAAYTGSNTLILRSALEEIGGFPCGTITEDFETSLRLQKAGYLTYATTEVLAAGLSTTTVESMIRQRIRWARGVIQSIQNTNAVFTGDLPLAGRLSYLNAYLYWWSFFSRIVFILSPVLFALFDVQLVETGFAELLVFWLPSHLMYSLSMKYLSTNIRSMRWSQIIDTILAPYLVFPVLLESIGIHQMNFKVTDKKKKGGNTAAAVYIIPHAVLILLTIAAMIRYSAGKYGTALIYSSVILFWLSYNLIALTYAVFFMLGRESKRKYDRIGAKERVLVTADGICRSGFTADVSEKGIAFRLMEKEDSGEAALESGKHYKIKVETGYYQAELDAELLYAKKDMYGWFYAACAVPVGENDKRQWFQIIHDREHSLPKEIDPWLTIYDDIRRNIFMRRFGMRHPDHIDRSSPPGNP